MRNLVGYRELLMATLVLAILYPAGLAQEHAASDAHKVVTNADLKWAPIISGWEIAVVSGNPDKEGEPFVIRFHGEDGATVPAHWHPTDENITVLKGAFLVGVGEKYDEGQLKPMNVGSFLTMPREMRHYARAQGETIIQAHGIGPFKVNWVNQADVKFPPVSKK